MGKYRLKYASVGGSITGKMPGDEVTVTGDEEQQLKDLGLIESEEDYQARQDARAQAEAEAAQQQTSTLEFASLSQVISPERIAQLVQEEEDRLLEPHKGKSGWYQFGEGDDTVKVQGRDAALTELAKRLNAEGGDDVESGDSANGQHPNP